MPEDIPAPATTAAAAPARPAGAIRRTLNWFWRGRQLKELRSQQKLDPQTQELALRGRLLLELGDRASNPSEPLPLAADAAAADLYRQAAFWAIRALNQAQGSHATEGDPWQGPTAGLAEKLAGSSEQWAKQARWVEEGAATQAWELTKEERALRAAELGRLARGLLEEMSWRTRARDALWIQRVVRIGLLFVVLGVGLGVTRWVMDSSERGRDIAAGKPWRASTTTAGYGCSSPLQQCADSSEFFFHTTDESSPWLEIDLGSPQQFSAVRVGNRRDCCFERAVPLLIEVGDDGQHFREVARRTTSFSSWLASFSPTKARYVRLRAQSRTILHLSQVRVLR